MIALWLNPDELFETNLWHILVRSCAKCCHTDQVQLLFCGVSAAMQAIQLARSIFVFRMPYDRLPKQILLNEVIRFCPPGRSRSSFNDIA